MLVPWILICNTRIRYAVFYRFYGSLFRLTEVSILWFYFTHLVTYYLYIYIYINSASYECNIAARKTLIYLEEYACKQIPLVLCSCSSDISGFALVFYCTGILLQICRKTSCSKFWPKDIHWEQKKVTNWSLITFRGKIFAFIVAFKFVQPGE